MRHPQPRRRLRLGLEPGDPYARWFNPEMAPLAPHVREALLVGPVAVAGELENGFGFSDDGALHVAVRTEMPGVTPPMIDWWFAWHSDEPSRYKLWHARAHVYAGWDRPGVKGYVGRTSFVDECLGSRLTSLAITFVPPARFGLPESSADATFICAEGGLAGTWLQGGGLIHEVRKVPGGSEMRSRFWVAGKHARIELRGPWSALLRAAARYVGPGCDDGRALLVHCAQEMSHLATFLPALYRDFS